MFSSPEFWVAVAFVIFVVAVFRPMSRQIATALDARGDRIRTELEEAQALREEAQKLLADSKRKQRDAIKESKEILAHAKVEAERLREQAKQDMDAALQRREQSAMDKIAQAEATALRDVRNQAVEVALSATASLIAANLDPEKHATLVDHSIRGVADKLG
jgi:F-type H+-transporting ATPase subunit b